MRRPHQALCWALLGLLVGAQPAPAYARSIAAIAGRAERAIQDPAFDWTTTGIQAPGSSRSAPRVFIIPVVLDDATPQAFVVRGAGNLEQVRCNVVERGTRNQATFVPVTPPGATPESVPIVGALPGNTLLVTCVFTSPEARVLMVEHAS